MTSYAEKLSPPGFHLTDLFMLFDSSLKDHVRHHNWKSVSIIFISNFRVDLTAQVRLALEYE